MDSLQTLSLSRLPWRLAALLALALAALIVLPAPALAQSPGVPSSVTVTRDAGTLTATWPAVNGAAKYHVAYTNDAGKTWHAAAGPDDNHAEASITITGVDNGKTYIVAVRAGNNSDQWGGWRNSDPADPIQAPYRPASVTVTRSGTTLTASWDAPDGAAKYHVTYSDDDGLNRAAAGPDDNYSATTIDITGIDTTKIYIGGVRAGNQYGWSSWRNSAPNAPAAPARPGPITVTRADGTLTASWDAVDGATKYHVTYSSTGGESWNLAAPNHTETSITITVDNQKTYVVAVRAGNAGGWSNWRNSASSAPHTPPPPPPAAPTQITVERICDHYFRVRWEPSPGATGYDLNISNNNRKTWKRALTDEPYNLWEFTKWSKNKTYWLAVRARNAGGESGWTNAAAAPPPTCEPDNLRVVTQTTQGQTGGSLTATWDAAKRAAGYNVNYSANGAQSWQRVADNQSATTYTRTVASPGNDVIAVQSVNGGGDLLSQWRNARAAWLTAGDVIAGGATLTLTGHSGDWYVKKTSPAPAGTCSEAISGNTHDLTGLDGGTAQTVTAYSDAGCVNAIANTTFTTLNPTLTVSDVTGSGATLNLADYSRNWYVKKTAPTPAGTCSSAITGTTHDLTGLTGGTNYYTYTAYSDSGCATALHSVTFATPVTVSNLGAAVHANSYVAGDAKSAMGFTTGRAAGGYTLSEITAKFGNKTDSNNAVGDVVATLHAKTSNNVGDNLAPASAALATLSGVNPDTAGDYTYTCAGTGCALEPNTTYFIQFAATAGNRTTDRYNWHTTLSDDQTTEPSGNGWTLADGADYLSGNSYSIEFVDTAYLKVAATVNPGLAASGITASGATLTLSDYDLAWWYQGSQSDAACQSAGTAATASLANLPTGASYTYTAYSDSSCATALASVTFSTPLTVGNLSETTHPSYSNEVGYKNSNANQRWANAFTTGSAAGGYTLHGVTFAFGATTGSPTRVHAKIYADTNGLPGTLVKNLGSKNPTSAGNQTWNCTGAGCTLSPDTTYHVALEADTTGTAAGHYYDWKITASANQTNAPAGAGWTLADYGSYKTNQGAWTAFGDEAGKFALSATALPGLAVSSIVDTTATLTLSNYSGAWWLKRTSPADATCKSMGTTTTESLANLTVGQSHTYKAYRTAACASADEIASVTFATIGLTAASVTGTTATLTIAGHTGNWYVKRTAPAPAGTCSRSIHGATHNLANLESGTTYTYKAYSQSGCDSANEIATLTFTTSSLAAISPRTSKADLSLSDYSGAWWYKGNQNGATCTSVTAGTTTATVTNLTRGQSYTYTAYSKANCNSADAIVSVTFTTPSLSVGNLIETKAGVLTIIDELEAIGFTTGDNRTGYRLWSVTARFDAAVYSGYGDITVAIYAESGSNPAATALYTLSGSNPVTAGDYTYTCSGGCTLDAKTTYYLVMSGTSTSRFIGYFSLHYTDSTHQTNTPLYAGWSIADAGKYHSQFSNSWTDYSTGVQQFELAASPNPNLAASGVTATTATLTLSNHDGAWWYKGNQSGATCTAVAAGTASASLASLTAGTSYTYKAYGKANCNSADELAAATFSTLAAFNANPVAATTATLNLTGHTGSWYVKETAPATNASCSTAITGTTHDLTGLTEGTSYYTYTAYSDSGCATALHSVTFATPLTVSNLGEAAYTASSFAAGSNKSAVGFTTGSAAGGYTLGAITARFKDKVDPNNALGDVVVTLHAAGANTTGDNLAPAVANLAWLSGANPDTEGDYTYTCAGAGCALAPDTTYFVQFAATAGDALTEAYNWSGTLSDNQTTAPSGNGWTLADETDYGNNRSYDSAFPDTAYLKVSATVNPGLAASGVTTTTATLTLSDYNGAWWYKGNQSGATCTAVTAGTATASLSSLTTNTSYTYTAYNKANCNSADELASVTFATGRMSVSNLAEPGNSPNGVNGTKRWSAAFTTGSHPGGYTLQSVTVPLSRVQGSGAINWAIHTATTDSDPKPTATVQATLSSSTPTSSSYANFTQTCSGNGCALLPDTTYFLVASTTSGNNFYWRLATTLNETAIPSGNGWSIGKGWYSDYSGGSWGNWATYDDVSKFKVSAIANPGLAASGVTTTTATLTLSDYNRAWWYKGSQSGATCTAVAAGTATASLASLTAGTSYTYTAYSKANCNSADEIAAVSFTTMASGNSQSTKVSSMTAPIPPQGTDAPPNPATAFASGFSGSAGQATGAADGGAAAGLPGYVSSLSSAQSGGTQLEAGDLAGVAFTTGPHPHGYTLDSFTARLAALGEDTDLVWTLHEQAGDRPSPTARATLTGTAPTADEFTDLTYTCAGDGCVLAPNTTYFVVAESVGSGVVSWAFIFSSATLSETTVPANNGWSLGHGHYSADGVTWATFQDWQHTRLDFTPR